MKSNRKRWMTFLLVVAAAIGGYYAWQRFGKNSLPPGIASGNGRIEAVEIDIATKPPGRIQEILVREGDFVTVGRVLARMDTTQLHAQLRQAEAQLRRAIISVDTAKSLVAQREAERKSATAVIAQRNAELDTADRKLQRSEQLIRTNAVPQQVLDDDRAAAEGAKAAVAAAEAQRAAAEAAISSGRAQVVDAEASIDSARAAIESIKADINDSSLMAPRDGRVQFRVAQPGEVLTAGGRVLNLVDLGEVYMTFFLPTAQAGRVAIGSEVRLVLDAAPQWVIPAKATFVASVAQFTPRTVETEEERQKLMFRIKAHISPELLRRRIEQVKTGLPGRAFIRIDPNAEWPAQLTENLVK
ncbi:HlyD family efflux transporter periplasmic adaptor subunit [Bradyrhizobium frederickii]|uniref:HlyD family efflux transporter periplasmic adaptor subunit n=1 Tax=Bradyrhizobium frederickii TaxID=2560054 RepID=A0A4Y9KTV9_9BRAD|nr:HlyD family efflux transporter periplasmic adaptor subunit [Bradyrhizobium frederickii]TFV30647.1 HlyD family efflux transporter periplasmic adaptor subunit [Bradyrhizobium frederickii]